MGDVCRMATLSALIFVSAVFGQDDSMKRPFPESACNPKVVVSLNRSIINLCLNRFEAGDDSCTDFTLRIQKPYRVDVRFRGTFNHLWYFDSVASPDTMAQLPPMHADVSVDGAGALIGMSLVFGSTGDSTKLFLNTSLNSDVHGALPDTAKPPIEYVLQKNAYRCVDRAVHGVVVQRTFTRPPGYMRREPVYNYPELAMFHCGRAVRIPSEHAIAERGFLMHYWHVLNPPPLKYDEEPLRNIDDRKSKTPAPKKEGFIKIRPLR